MKIRVSLLSAAVVLAIAAAAAPAFAQTAVTPAVYLLSERSRFEEGCFPPCLCPIMVAERIEGTFGLARASVDPLFANYDVVGVNWLVRLGGQEIRVTGSGIYRIGGEFALMHQLVLDLVVGDKAPQRFDSGLVAGGSGFPAIDLTIAVNAMICHDTAITVSARPVPAAAIQPYVVPGSEYQEGCFGPCDCLVRSWPVTGRFGLLKIGEFNGVTDHAVVGLNLRISGLPASTSADATPVRGQGIYSVAPAAREHRMVLDLSIDGGEAERFDSGWSPGGGSLRRFQVALAAGGFACFDRVIDLRARAVRRATSMSGGGYVLQGSGAAGSGLQ